MKSKKERAFYTQVGITIFYVVLRAFRPDLSGFDAHFSGVMICLASYHVVQGAIDYKNGAVKQ